MSLKFSEYQPAEVRKWKTLDKKENKSNSKAMDDTERRKEIYQGEKMENRGRGAVRKGTETSEYWQQKGKWKVR